MPCTARDETEAQRWGQGLDDTQLGLGDSRRASPGKAQSPDFSGRWGHKNLVVMGSPGCPAQLRVNFESELSHPLDNV